MNIKKLIIASGVLVCALATVWAVGAQDNQPGPRGGRPFRQGVRAVVEIVAEAVGLRPTEIITQMSQGNTLADIIEANGGDVQIVIDQAVTQLTADINQAVTDGKLRQERADLLLSNLEDMVTRSINGEFRERAMKVRVGIGVLRLAGDQTGLTPREIVQEIRSGKSLGQVLTEHGVDTAAFIDTAVNTLQEHLTQAVSNGRLTQEEADQKVTEFRERLTERINQVGEPESVSMSA